LELVEAKKAGANGGIDSWSWLKPRRQVLIVKIDGWSWLKESW
jgi:hypothetical protein